MNSTAGAVIPAAPPPPGVTPNFENPESSSHQLIIVSVVFPVLSFFFLFPRLYTASCILRKWHTDDYLICVASAFGLANAIVCIIQSTMGMGKHIWDLDFKTFSETMKIMMLGGALTYNLTTMFVKLSILSFYLRFSVDRAFRVAVYIVMFIAVGYSIPNAFLFLFNCRPIQSYWDWTIPSEYCINQQAIFDASNILNMVTDFLILLLPIWMLRPMRAPLLKKIGIALILMAGGFVCGVSTFRMVTGMMGAGNTDITWHYPVNLIWCLVEEYVGIICACLPCLKAFTKRVYPSLFLFSPDFSKRVASSFPFASLNIRDGDDGNGGDTTTTIHASGAADGNGNGNGNESGGGDVGGRKAWWRLRRAGVRTSSRVTAGSDKSGSKGSVDGDGSGGDVEAARGVEDDKRLDGVTAVEREG